MTPLLLTERDVRAVLPMADLIDEMGHALDACSAGRVLQPVRTVLEVGADRNYFGLMPASLNDSGAVGAKLVTVYHRNHERGLPSHLATIVLLDPATGALAALLDGRYITEARTAAVSAVSVRYLARPGASVLGIVGSGVQARSHLEAIRHVADIKDVRVWSPNAAKRDAFAREMNEAGGPPVRAVADAAAAVNDADIVVLATSSKVPVVNVGDIATGAHIAAVGACRPDQREMPAALIARARVFVDSRAAALKEAGDLLLPIQEGVITPAHIAGELGMAVEDVATARLVVARARDAKLGTPISLE